MSPARFRILSATLRRAALAIACLAAAFAAARTAAAGEPELPVRELRDAVRSRTPGPEVRPYVGVVLAASSSGPRVAHVVPGSPADRAGLCPGDVVVSVGGRSVRDAADLDLALLEGRPGETSELRLLREGSPVRATVRMGGRRPADGVFRGSVFRLAVVPLRFRDDRNEPSSADHLARLLFGRAGRAGRGASLADYLSDQSAGRFTLDGEVLAPVVLPSPRSSYAAQPMGAAEGSAFRAAAAVLEARHGGAGLDRFDGVAFLYPGPTESRAGLAFWPHRAAVDLGGRRVPYYVQGSGGEDGSTIGIHCHEFGHLLGLADAYGAGHRTGFGDFCLMAIGHRGGPREGSARPFSLCAQCKVRLGWIDPVVVDPSTPQRLRLRPVGSALDQALVVPLDAACAEYVLLEVRARAGFDLELPSAGLLVWHAGGAPRPGQSAYAQGVDLVEAHGIDVFDASLVRTDEIAFPTPRARDVTPDTVPGLPRSRSGRALHLTDIRRESDGSVVLTLGVARGVRQDPPAPQAPEPVGADGCVTRRDPITGEVVRFLVRGAAGAEQATPDAGSGRGR